MNDFYIKHLPHWVLTDLQPAFYDVESGTTIQQTARMYSKMEELIDIYNEFVTKINRYITDFESGIIEDFEEFKNCIIKTMNDYIETIDMKINIQDTTIADSIERQDKAIEDKFDEQDENINNAINYMKDNIVETTRTVINEGIENGSITVALNYTSATESLEIVVTEGDDQ